MRLDTSLWIDHRHHGDARAAAILEEGDVVCHLLVIGDLECGSLIRGSASRGLLGALPQSTQSTHAEIIGFIGRHRLHGKGLGLIDLHLLWAATSQTPVLWTWDRRLRGECVVLGIRMATGAVVRVRPVAVLTKTESKIQVSSVRL